MRPLCQALVDGWTRWLRVASRHTNRSALAGSSMPYGDPGPSISADVSKGSLTSPAHAPGVLTGGIERHSHMASPFRPLEWVLAGSFLLNRAMTRRSPVHILVAHPNRSTFRHGTLDSTWELRPSFVIRHVVDHRRLGLHCGDGDCCTNRGVLRLDYRRQRA